MKRAVLSICFVVIVAVPADAAPITPLTVEKADPAALGMVRPVEGELGLAFGETDSPIYDAPGLHTG